MISLKTLWQFSRPHTIIGSICSITTLYILATIGNEFMKHFYTLLLTIVAGIACNIFIVGLNQIVDVDLDRINKPYLPIAAGKLKMAQAQRIIFLSFFISIAIGFLTSWVLGIMICIIHIIGIAYSVPPIQLKKHHLPAAVCITLVRGLIVNIGMFVHFRYCIYGTSITQNLPAYIWPLTFFIIAFSIAIAWFKDLPDTEGDSSYNIKTLAILYSKKTALWGGSIIVLLAYLYAIIWSIQNSIEFLSIAHSIAVVLFCVNLFYVKLSEHQSIKKFYLRFWIFFFAEYIFFAIWALSL
jgi:homogentisate phytyltransferase / homogentisate geranylgeranyltransferase